MSNEGKVESKSPIIIKVDNIVKIFFHEHVFHWAFFVSL